MFLDPNADPRSPATPDSLPISSRRGEGGTSPCTQARKHHLSSKAGDRLFHLQTSLPINSSLSQGALMKFITDYHTPSHVLQQRNCGSATGGPLLSVWMMAYSHKHT